MNKEKDSSKAKKDQSRSGVETPPPPQHIDPSKKPDKGKDVIGDKQVPKKKS
jgi:hypothetical protein